MKYPIGTIKELWRYPVKSMEGELIDQAHIEKAGLLGDRYWAIRDLEQNETTGVKKIPKLLRCSARYHGQPRLGQMGEGIPDVEITLPDGQSFSTFDEDADDKLSTFLKKKVSIERLRSKFDWRFYALQSIDGEKSLKRKFQVSKELPTLTSISWLKLMELSVFATPLGRFYDVYPLHVLTTNSLNYLKEIAPDGDFQSRRFRPNILIESAEAQNHLEEFDWVGGKLHIGNVVIRCESRTVRCSMPAQPQPGLGKDSLVLRTLEKYTQRHLGINVTVIKKGSIKRGDAVFFEPESKFALRRAYEPVSNRVKDAYIRTTLKWVDKLGG